VKLRLRVRPLLLPELDEPEDEDEEELLPPLPLLEEEDDEELLSLSSQPAINKEAQASSTTGHRGRAEEFMARFFL